jgi:NAD(P)-dependent dehydrogenase (short-subunit alcohol dehydrogenase family)
MTNIDTSSTNIPDDLEGRVAVVTGASGATGGAVAARLVAGGATVLGVARKPPAEDGTGRLRFTAADLTAPDGATPVAERITADFGRADIVVHVVGGSSSPSGGFAALDDAAWYRELELNLLAAVRLDRALVPLMVAGTPVPWST